MGLLWAGLVGFGVDGFLFWILWVLDLGDAAVGLAVLLHGRRVSVCFRVVGLLVAVWFCVWLYLCVGVHWLVGLARCVCVLVVAVTFVSWV